MLTEQIKMQLRPKGIVLFEKWDKKDKKVEVNIIKWAKNPTAAHLVKGLLAQYAATQAVVEEKPTVKLAEPKKPDTQVVKDKPVEEVKAPVEPAAGPNAENAPELPEKHQVVNEETVATEEPQVAGEEAPVEEVKKPKRTKKAAEVVEPTGAE